MAQIIKEGKLHYKGKDGHDYVVMPSTKSRLITMTDGKTLEETIENLKSLATGIKFEITALDWEASVDYEGLQEVTLLHNLGIELENFSISFYHQNEGVDLDFKIVDLNSLIIYSDIATDITVAIKQCVETNVELPQDLLDKVNANTEAIKAKADAAHTHDYATTNHKHTMEDIEDLKFPSGFITDWGKLGELNMTFPQAIIDSNIARYPYWIIAQKIAQGENVPMLIMATSHIFYGKNDSWPTTLFFESASNGSALDLVYYRYQNNEWQEPNVRPRICLAIFEPINNEDQPTPIYFANHPVRHNGTYKNHLTDEVELTVDASPVDGEITEVKMLGGTTEHLSTYTGAERQLVINTETKDVHLMDGVTAGGIPLAKKSDIIETDLSDYYNKEETYSKEEINLMSPPKDFGEFIVNGSLVKPPKGYNNEDFAIYTSLSVSNLKYFIVDPYRSGGGSGGLYGKMAMVSNSSHDFSGETITTSSEYIATQSEMTSSGMKTVKQLGSTQAMVNKLKSLGFGNVESLDVNNYDKLYNQQILKANDTNIKQLLGKTGQLAYNTDTKTIHTMDGKVPGGKALAKREEVYSKEEVDNKIKSSGFITHWGKLFKDNIPAITDLNLPTGGDVNKYIVFKEHESSIYKLIFARGDIFKIERNDRNDPVSLVCKAIEPNADYRMERYSYEPGVDTQWRKSYDLGHVYFRLAGTHTSDKVNMDCFVSSIPIVYGRYMNLSGDIKQIGLPNSAESLVDVQHKHGDSKAIDNYVGKSSEFIHNTDDNTIHVMDGVKAGGHKIGGAKPLLTGINMMEASNEVELVFNNSTTRNFKFIETDGELTKIIDKNNNIEILINKR